MLNPLTEEWLHRLFTGASPGNSGDWGDKKKSVKEMMADASSAIDKDKTTEKKKTAQQNTADKAKALLDQQIPQIPQTQQKKINPAGPPGSPPKIAKVNDRYANMYRQSQQNLNDYTQKYFAKGVDGVGGSDSMNAYNSPQQGALLMANRQAFRLLRGGSFADNANLKAEERAKNAAQAQSSMADITYKQNLGNTAVANANTNINAENRKQHESITAERYLLNTPGKSKKKDIDLNDIYSLFKQ